MKKETINTNVNTDNVGKHTKGEWQVSFAKWAKDAPIQGFRILSGKKDICSLNVRTESSVLPDEYFSKMNDLALEHLTSDECEANAALIVKAVNNHYDLVEALTNMVAFYEGDANLAYIDKAKELLNNINKSK